MTIPPFGNSPTNAVTNPSAAVDTSGWSSFAATISRSTSLPGTPPGVSTGFLFTATTAAVGSMTTIVTLDNAVPHHVRAWVYIPSSWTGGNIDIRDGGFTGKSGGFAKIANMGLRDAWQEVVANPMVPSASDLSGTVQVVGSNIIAGETFYVTRISIRPGGTLIPGYLDTASNYLGPLRTNDEEEEA